MIKICYLIVSIESGGDKTYVYSLLKQLDRNKFDITLVCDTKGKYSKLFKFNDVKVKRIPISGRYNIRGFCYLYKLFKKEKFDIIHTNNIKVDVMGLLAAFFSRIPVRIATIHGDTKEYFHVARRGHLYSKLYLLLLRLAYHSSTKLITVSKANRESIEIITGKKPVEVIYHGYEPVIEFESNVKLPSNFDELPNIIYNGRISPEKGFHVLVESIHILKKNFEKVAVIVLGSAQEDKYFNKVKKMIQDYEISEFFYFAGFVDNVHAWIINAKLLVLPSLSESMGFSILDAWNCKIPVIASNVGGIPEVITEGKNGLLIESANALELFQKISYLIKNPNICEQMGENGYKTLISHFNIKHHISRMEKIYTSILH